MEGNFSKILKDFIIQANSSNLTISQYPKKWNDLRLRVSFGMGSPARIPWIAFITPEMEVSNGFYPVYLYYKAQNILILAYGVSETEEYKNNWPLEVQNESNTIKAFFNGDILRYGDSFIFKAYKVNTENPTTINFSYMDGSVASDASIEADLETILDYYQKVALAKLKDDDSPISQGLFYMEKQLEDFLIHNWEKTELGKRFDLILEDGVPKSQQYVTDIGKIDILVREKKSKSYVVIELKRNQTSDDTIGQVTRYMGWVKEKLGDENVKGIIIAGAYDTKLKYAIEMIANLEVYSYKVDFKLTDFNE